jgi:ribonuclease T2
MKHFHPFHAAAFLACLGAALPSAASAQAFQCRMPQITAAPKVEQNGETRRTPVTGYTLALSWSPEFCKPREGQRAHRLQCSGRNGRFGFTVHGLWPNSARSWPQWCAGSRGPALTGAELRRNLCMMPSTRLAARQWAKHGSCMVRRPKTYFEVTRILYNSLRFPDFDRLSRKPGLNAGDLREWFLAANSGWRRDAIGIKVNSRGWLQELRLCYNKRFRPAPCDKARFGPEDDRAIKIWRGL